jgi:hypothetical protein
MVNENRNGPAGRGVSGGYECRTFSRKVEYIVFFTKDIMWRKRRWANHLGGERQTYLPERS